MSGSTEVLKDFATPDRPPNSVDALGKKDNAAENGSDNEQLKVEKPKPATVTPPESVSRESLSVKNDAAKSQMQMVTSQVESPEDKHVRFDKGMVSKSDSATDSPSTPNSQRGLVSRRGGRCGSPGRVSSDRPTSTKDSVLEFKTYRSPPRKKDSDAVPSLCSANSPEKEDGLNVELTDEVVTTQEEDAVVKEEDPGSSTSSNTDNKEASALSVRESDKSRDKKAKGGKADTGRNVSFSPVPPAARDNPLERPARTPTRSPTGGRFQSLPMLDDAARSPLGMFLSPHPATPSSRILKSDSFGTDFEDMPKKSKDEDKQANGLKTLMRSPKTPRSPRTPRRDMDRDRFLATPTDFAMDYGKHPNSSSFDSSNVLAWLQSPTANGLFSPGGFGSILNTPRGAPRTPRTPTVSTSFFFSDVAGLPRSTDVSPKVGSDAGKRGVSSQRSGYSNIICISPLASSRSKNGANQSYTPTINYKDMFASPEKGRLPYLADTPIKGGKSRGLRSSRDPNLDAVHMAERDLMEDEDLSVLLQLASNTPRSTGDRPVAVSTSDGTHVFRAPQHKRNGDGDENLPSLQLPIIGGRDSEGNGTRLARKTHSRDHGETTDEFHRPLTMRSNSSGGKDDPNGKLRRGDEKTSDIKQLEPLKSDLAKKSGKPSSHLPPPPTYSMPPHPYGHPEPPFYPPMPPGMPHGGSMRVVVGGPPPSRSKSSPPRSPHRPYAMGDPGYPPPPYPPPGHYPHHPGVPPPHMHPHYGHYPPPHHPPARHMPMYGAQHQPDKPKSAKKVPKPVKQGIKRPAPSPAPAATPTPKTPIMKKPKKPSPSSDKKKKNRSPQITDKVERQKAAATIQAVNAASGCKNDKAAALAAAILRGVTMRPSGKWQAQLYFAGKSRYIGVFDTREKAALAYEIAREKLKTEKSSAEGGALSSKATEAAVNAARKAAFEGVNEKDPRLASK